MNYITHPVYDREYDCGVSEVIEGERRWHGKGEKSNCPACERYLKSFG